MDIRSYVGEKKSSGSKETPGSLGASFPQDRGDFSDDLRKASDAYAGKSESQLMEELSKSIAQGKRDGTFSQESVNAFIKKVSPMLSEAQKKKLQSLLSQLR